MDIGINDIFNYYDATSKLLVSSNKFNKIEFVADDVTVGLKFILSDTDCIMFGVESTGTSYINRHINGEYKFFNIYAYAN